MRITGGEFGGRNLKVPKSDAIRPTQDRVREALFNIIQFEVPGSDFLDLFAGSGAVGIEALSRGAKSATFVEANRRHFAVLEENLASLGSGRVGLGSARVGVGSGRVGLGSSRGKLESEGSSNRPVQDCPNQSLQGCRPLQDDPNRPKRTLDDSTVVLADVYRWIGRYSGPGFSIGFADPPYALGEEKGYASVLATLAARGVIREGGLFVAEMTAVQKAEETPGWELVRDRTYGKTRLCIWRRKEQDI